MTRNQFMIMTAAVVPAASQPHRPALLVLTVAGPGAPLDPSSYSLSNASAPSCPTGPAPGPPPLTQAGSQTY